MALGAVTISTHNGSAVSRDHNRRLPSYVRAQPHIDPAGVHEVWVDQNLRVAYQAIFGAAVSDYNQHQRTDRQISDYLRHVEADKQKHPVYEMVVGIYGTDPYTDQPVCDTETGRQIMREYVATWEQRNPNLALVGVYYHADEEGAPHLHIDYVPWSDGYKKGPYRQNGLRRALESQGFHKRGRETAQIQWQRSENAVLEDLCNVRGYVVDHPDRDGERARREHLQTDIYKAQAERDRIVEQARELDRISQRNYELLVAKIKKLTDRTLWQFVHGGRKHTDGSITLAKDVADQLDRRISALYETVSQLAPTKQDIEHEYALAQDYARAAMHARAQATETLHEAERIRREEERLHTDLDREIITQAYDLVNRVVQRELGRLKADHARQERLYEFLRDQYGMDGVQAEFEAYEAQQAREAERLAREELAQRRAEPERASREDRGMSR